MPMLKITEEYLQFAWKFNLYEKNILSWNHETIEISNPGEQNHSSGPDFFNARVKIGNTTWAGNVEIHLRASDWYRHKHEKDPEYDSIILHVVLEADCDIFRINGEKIPVLEIKPCPEYLEKYYKLILNKTHIHCSHCINALNRLLIKDLITKMTISRLMDKTERVFIVLGKNHYDWEETLYRFLGNSFGLNINKLPFTLLVESVPLKILLKYRNNPETINAILFGQAGFLEDIISGDKYYDTLRKEYMSLRKMLPQRVLFPYSWKFMRLRPANFPTIRISQFASLVIKGFPLFTNIIECSDVLFMEKLFSLNTNKYWEDHMLFGRTNKRSICQMGKDTAKLIIINAVIPVLFSYGKFRMRNDLQDRSLRFLEELPPEKNEIMNKWKKAGIYPENAFESQGLLQLYNNYCKPRKCLECIVGCKMVTAGHKQ